MRQCMFVAWSLGLAFSPGPVLGPGRVSPEPAAGQSRAAAEAGPREDPGAALEPQAEGKVTFNVPFGARGSALGRLRFYLDHWVDRWMNRK